MTDDEQPSPRVRAIEADWAFTRRLEAGSLGAPGARARIRRAGGHTLTAEELAAIDTDEADLDRTFRRRRKQR